MTITSGILNAVINEAKKSTYRYKVGACIFKNKRIISRACNSVRSNPIHPKYQNYLNSYHAEQRVVVGLEWKSLKGCNIIIIRINNNNELRNAKPCKKCIELIKHLKLFKIYYSTNNGEIIMEKVKNL